MYLMPTALFDAVEQITPQLLGEYGVSGLILDVDNTLAADGSGKISPAVAGWLDSLGKAGIKAVIISNNDEPRVRPFADKIGLPFCAKALKPRLAGFNRALALMNLTKDDVAVIGDQLFTDIWLAKRVKCRSFLVRPVSNDIYPFVRFKRKLEKPLMNVIERRLGNG